MEHLCKMKIHTYGSYFWHTIRIRPKTQFHLRANTNEGEKPFRTSQSHLFRMWPLNRALVLGKWKRTGHNEEQAMEALLRTDIASKISHYGKEEARGFYAVSAEDKAWLYIQKVALASIQNPKNGIVRLG